jgi:hypothetical protein
MAESVFDRVIRGGRVVDGSGMRPSLADVVLRADLARDLPAKTERTVVAAIGHRYTIVNGEILP